MSELLPAGAQEAAAGAALRLATAAAQDLAREAKRDKSIAWRWASVSFMFLLLCGLCYLLVRDARDGHAITKEEYEAANRERDERVSQVKADFQGIALRLTAAIEGVSALRTSQEGIARDVRDAESRLRGEIQGTNARVDRVLEAIGKPK